jgi:hypothetical protein
MQYHVGLTPRITRTQVNKGKKTLIGKKKLIVRPGWFSKISQIGNVTCMLLS